MAHLVGMTTKRRISGRDIARMILGKDNMRVPEHDEGEDEIIRESRARAAKAMAEQAAAEAATAAPSP